MLTTTWVYVHADLDSSVFRQTSWIPPATPMTDSANVFLADNKHMEAKGENIATINQLICKTEQSFLFE